MLSTADAASIPASIPASDAQVAAVGDRRASVVRRAAGRSLTGVEILHLAHRSDWDAALASGTYGWSTRGRTYADVGFIHASSRAQLPAVAELVYAGDDAELCVLLLETDAIAAAGTRVVYEDGGNGQVYPHVYGPIDPAWVVDVVPAHLAPDGTFRWGSAR